MDEYPTFELGQTVLFKAQLTQPNSIGTPVLVDPTSLQLKLTDPNSLVTMLTASKATTGNWKVQAVLGVKGPWLAKWISDPISGTCPGLQSFKFLVVDTGA